MVVGAGRGAGGGGCGGGGGEVRSVVAKSGLGEVGFSWVGEGEAAWVSGLGFNGVLRGDLKGWERVFVAVLSRRRFDGWMGDMTAGEEEKECYALCLLEGVNVKLRSRRWAGASDALRSLTFTFV